MMSEMLPFLFVFILKLLSLQSMTTLIPTDILYVFSVILSLVTAIFKLQ